MTSFRFSSIKKFQMFGGSVEVVSETCQKMRLDGALAWKMCLELRAFRLLGQQRKLSRRQRKTKRSSRE